MLIRDATDADWPAIWPFYREIVAGGETYALPDDEGPDEAKAQWFVPGHQVAVAVDDDGTVLGSAHFGPNRPARGSHVATGSFMVASAAAGQGVGRALGKHAIEGSATAGFHSMQFNAVVASNTRAVALWQSLGFTIIGTVPEAFDHPTLGLVGLHVMYRTL